MLPRTPSGRPLGRRTPHVPHHTLRVARAAALVDSLPVAVDLRPLCPPVQDQGQQGSCTAHALAGAMGILRCRAVNDGLWQGGEYRPSRAFIYYQERASEGATALDNGAVLFDGVAVVETGVPDETAMPYSDLDYTTPPPASVERVHRVTNADPLALDLATILGTLAQGYPVVVGVQVHPSFEAAGDNGGAGDVPLPTAGEEALGGHAITLVGYDLARGVVRFRNSWGTSWGDGGYGTLAFGYVTDALLCDEAYALRVLV